MTRKQRLELKLSELRGKLGGILDIPDDQRAETWSADLAGAKTELRSAETEFQAAVLVEPTAVVTVVDAGDLELRSLIDGSNVGRIFDATLNHSTTTGRERELQQHLGLTDNQVPLELLETRAVTPAPASVGQNQAPIIPGVFPSSVAAWLGIDMPTVAVGEAVFPVLTTNAVAGTPAENAAAAETTGSFSADVLTPSRLQSSFFYSRESAARFSGMEEALRENLSMALSDGLDREVLTGASGLLTASVLAANAAAAATTFANYRGQLCYGRIDGKFAAVESDLRVLVGSETLAHMGGAYRGSDADLSALDSLRRIGVQIRVGAHIPAVASKKQNALVRRGMRRDMVAPIWQGVTIIPDEITLAAKGQIVITAVMLHAVKILRADGFHKQEIQTS